MSHNRLAHNRLPHNQQTLATRQGANGLGVKGARFPFPSFPTGWYVVAFSSDVGPGERTTVHYFGQDIVLFRTETGVLSAIEPICPHLGAHLGGGRVEGECLRCPFHGWAFGADGQCVEVPYAPKIPPKARVTHWPMREQNGVVLVYYSGAARVPAAEATTAQSLSGPEAIAAPPWTPPLLEEHGWTPNRNVRWELRSHPQEVGENTVDCAHLGPVHDVQKTEVLEVEQHEHFMRVLLHLVATGQVIGMPDEINDVHLDVTLHGLGLIISNTHVITAGLRTRQRIYPTPIDGERIAIFAVANTLEMSDAGYTREIDEIFWHAFNTDFVRDFPIWENKAYLERPLLAGGDGPIGLYRRWACQFYGPADAASTEGTEAPIGTLSHGTALGAHVAQTSPRQRGRTNQGIASHRGGLLGSFVGLLRRSAARLGIGSYSREQSRNSEAADAIGASAANAADTTRPTTRNWPREGPEETNSTAGNATAHNPPARGPATKRRFDSVDAYFDSLPARFNPRAAGQLQAVFQWVLTGDGRRDQFAEVTAGQVRTALGVHGAPTVTIEMSADDYLKMINGELNGALAFSTGRGKLRGPVRLAMSMQRIFPLDRMG